MRMGRLLCFCIAAVTLCSTTSCGTIFIGARENILFTSNLPSNTPVKLVVDGERIGYKVCFPTTVSVRRGYAPSYAIAETEGYEASSVTIRKKFHPAILANIVLGGVIGACVDLGSGAVSQAEKKCYEFYFTKDKHENKSADSQYREKQEEKDDTIYKIGDLYSDIGQKGIVVSVSEDGKHGKIISLQQAYEVWSRRMKCYIANSYISGQVNHRAIPTIADVPAMYWCVSQGDVWYLPAVNEMKVVYENIDIINKSLKQHGGTEILPSDMYWTSTEHNRTVAVAIQSSGQNLVRKSETALVVAMSTF